MENKIEIFKNDRFGNIRIILLNDEPWFVGKDIAVILGYSNPQKAVRDHVDHEDRTVNESFTVNGTPITLINESGLFSADSTTGSHRSDPAVQRSDVGRFHQCL